MIFNYGKGEYLGYVWLSGHGWIVHIMLHNKEKYIIHHVHIVLILSQDLDWRKLIQNQAIYLDWKTCCKTTKKSNFRDRAIQNFANFCYTT